MKVRTLGARPAGIILGSALVISVIATVAIVRADVRDITDSHHSLADGLIRQMGRAGHLALLAGDRGELREIARSALDTDPVIGTIAVYAGDAEPATRITREPAEPTRLQRAAARLARAVTRADLQREYVTRIPPTGEGTPLDPFGTPRADIGRAVLTLSATRWTEELATAVFDAARLGLFVFAGLTLTGFLVAWTVGRPLLRLGRRLRDLSGSDAPVPQSDLEGSLEAIGQRLNRSETRARRASEALRDRERELDRARRHSDNAARLRADLIAGMSHELRAPLTAILGHTDLLARGRLDRAQRDQVATVRKSARNLLGVIDDVLEWSGLESGRARLDEVGFNLAETIEDTVTLLAPMAFDKDLELVHLIYQDVPLRLRGDPVRFQQILTNLVSNAIKFTASGSVVVRTMLEDEDDESVHLRVSVADTGPGIDAADRARLFSMYERLGHDDEQAGSGLGLAISKRLLDMMGGHIDVDSEPGQGATFHFTLPLQKALHREQRVIPWAGLNGKRVWLVEAFDAARKALTHHLESWQISTRTLADIATLNQALDAGHTESQRPDTLIIGLRTADIHDPDVTAALARAAAAGIPALVLVTAIDSDVHEAMEQAGAARSLPKSINRLRLYRELCELTGVDGPTPAASDDRGLTDVQALVADDSPASQRYMAALLTELGARVAVAGDGNEAVDAWRKGAFPLVLLDDRMPGLGGVETTARIRELATEAARPVIIGITADAAGDALARFRAAGADDCLVKPFNENEIARRIAPLLGTGTPRSSGERGERLATDPQMAAMLAQELPTQVTAVTDALAAGDTATGREAIHTLHGTAAFYGLDELRDRAGRMEDALAAGESSEELVDDLLRAAADARDTLAQRAAG